MIILAVFRSRSHSLDYAQRLNASGVVATTISAPPETKIGCGLCVRFEGRHFVRAKAILKMGSYASFKGFYKVDYIGGGAFVTPYR